MYGFPKSGSRAFKLFTRLNTRSPLADVEILLVKLDPETKALSVLCAFTINCKARLTLVFFCTRMILSLLLIFTLIFVNTTWS